MTQPLVDDFIKLWGTCGTTWQTLTYRGVPCQQGPCDVWMVQEIIHETQPRVIVETGFAQGGSALLWLNLLRNNYPNGYGKVASVDIAPAPASDFQSLMKDAERGGNFKHRLFTADSASRETADAVWSWLDELHMGDKYTPKTMVILDSCHTKEHVLRELEVWSPLVSPGCYLLVQDTLAGRLTHFEVGPGPGAAVDEWLPKNPEFQADPRRERLLLTGHRGGYLKRAETARGAS